MIKRVRAEWRDVVLVCRKCSKKLGGGFDPKSDKRLAEVLRKALAVPGEKKAEGRHGRIGVIEVGCFDVCPKGAVTALRAGAPGDGRIIPAGTPTQEVVDALGLTKPAGEGIGT